MGNIGGGEILMILLVALIFLGPEKLPDVARQVGRAMGELRKVSAGFQREMHEAMRVPETATPHADAAPPVLAQASETHTPNATEAGIHERLPAGAFDGVVVAAEAPPLPSDLAHGGDR
jgi:sec-independent protein translocase protein TatB